MRREFGVLGSLFASDPIGPFPGEVRMARIKSLVRHSLGQMRGIYRVYPYSN